MKIRCGAPQPNPISPQLCAKALKCLLVGSRYHSKLAEMMKADCILEKREKKWESTFSEKDTFDLTEQAIVSFDKACVHSGILVQYVSTNPSTLKQEI